MTIVLDLVDLARLATVGLPEALLAEHLNIVQVLSHEIRLQECDDFPFILFNACLFLFF